MWHSAHFVFSFIVISFKYLSCFYVYQFIYREVCHVRGQSSAVRILRSAEMKRGLQMEPKAIEEYCCIQEVNHYPCGFIIHPDAPWLGSSPDGLVYDPKANPVFGLVEVKCPNLRSYVDCAYLSVSGGVLQLKQSLITGRCRANYSFPG